MSYGRPIGHNESQFIVDSYLGGSSTIQLGLFLGRRASTIRNHLVRKGVDRRSSNERKYTLNDSYFDDLSQEGPSYWLGALTADGSISGNRVSLDVKSSDRNL